ncbi:hypothetical protein JKP88DRAFT_260201 [Tribonema minus]|uniref:USP domain-containing protein n=1 Tax=Tribonema minus TaxID=303371 RepID=A0A835Z5P0_9STRA|nr:hypothetical protein JKP88DRAFT_260201 [Tribonema minus]
MGNTCFMNTALQCLSNCIPLTDYFLGYDFKKEINATNPIGFKGAVAEAYGLLVNTLWQGARGDALAPSDFKSAIDAVMPHFQGYAQHDVHEFLAFLLDAVHEDLNRVEAAAREAWRGYLLRNKPIIVDLFQGQLRSSLQCRRCLHTSVTFDPFMYLSVPMPRDSGSSSGDGGGSAPSLERCIELFCEEESLSGENAWFCPKCRTATAATVRMV